VTKARDFFRAFFFRLSQSRGADGTKLRPRTACPSGVNEGGEKTERKNQEREHPSKNASICRSSNTSVLAKELPNYRFFFLAKIAFQLSL
jgi:hypothetical protein